MRSNLASLGIFVALLVLPAADALSFAGPIPPGRQHRLTIEGENTITFIPEAGLPPFPIDYKASIEYIIDTRFGKETKPSAEEVKPKVEEPAAPEKTSVKAKGASAKAKAKKKSEIPPSRATGAVDLSLHSSEITLRQAGQPVLETRVTRSKFQGRLQPDSPVMSVTARDAPPMLQDILKRFDTIAASMSLDDDYKVINRRYRFEGPQRAVTETILSIHAPIPRGVDSWESPTQLAMGHGQTAKGTLHFEKDKASPSKVDGPIKVKVSGVLKAEGAIAGRFIKDGTYTVTGEQTYDSHTKEWTASRWSVVIVNELANAAGLTVAHARGKMTVQSRALDGANPPLGESAEPKL